MIMLRVRVNHLLILTDYLATKLRQSWGTPDERLDDSKQKAYDHCDDCACLSKSQIKDQLQFPGKVPVFLPWANQTFRVT